MPDDQPTTDQFWLLTGSVPTGPFTVTQIHTKLAAREVTWQTPACLVGGSSWLPIVQTPGIGPPVMPTADSDTMGSSLPTPPRPAEVTSPNGGQSSVSTSVASVAPLVPRDSNTPRTELEPPPLPPGKPTPVQAGSGEEPPLLTAASWRQLDSTPSRADSSKETPHLRRGVDRPVYTDSQASSSAETPPPPPPSVANTNTALPLLDHQGNFQKDLADVRTVGWWVAVLIASPTFPTIITGLSNRQHAGIDEVAVLWQIFLFTFPLTLGVALDAAILFGMTKDNAWHRQDKHEKAAFWPGLILILAGSALLGNWLGLGVASVPVPELKSGASPAVFVFGAKLLSNYFVLYGPQMFFSSLLVGTFMGWACSVKILPHLIQHTSPLNPATSGPEYVCPECHSSTSELGNGPPYWCDRCSGQGKPGVCLQRASSSPVTAAPNPPAPVRTATQELPGTKTNPKPTWPERIMLCVLVGWVCVMFIGTLFHLLPGCIALPLLLGLLVYGLWSWNRGTL